MTRNTNPQDHSNSNDGKGQGKRNPGGNKPSADEKNGDGRRNGSESGGATTGTRRNPEGCAFAASRDGLRIRPSLRLRYLSLVLKTHFHWPEPYGRVAAQHRATRPGPLTTAHRRYVEA